MICPNCKKKINNDSKFCPRCGKVFEKGDVKKYSDIYNTDYLEIYYPNKSKRFKIWGVSLRYALFTYIYAIYQKMYLCAFLSILSLLYWWYVVPRFLFFVKFSRGFFFYPFFYTLEVGAFIYFFYIFKFDKILEEKRKMRINRILVENPDKSKNELMELVAKDEHNKKGLIITIIISAIVIPILIYYYYRFKVLYKVDF